MQRQPLPYHPLLLAFALTLHFALTANVDGRSAVRALVVAPSLALVVTGLLWLVTRNRHLAGVGANVLLASLLIPGAVVLLAALVDHSEPWFLIGWLLLVAATLALSLRLALRLTRGWTWPGTTARLNRLAAFVLTVVVVSGVAGGSFSSLLAGFGQQPAAVVRDRDNPDVVLVLLDGYPRADTLARLFDFDNAAFLADLERRGFSVASRSRSNYLGTQMTLISMLHMRHLTELPGYLEVSRRAVNEGRRVSELINDGPVLDEFRDEGYETISFASGIERVTLRAVDRFVDSGTLNEFEYHLLRTTLLGDILSQVDPAFMARQHHERVTHSFDELQRIATTDVGGRLMLGHILSPHMPAVFNRDGSLREARFSGSFFADRPIGHDGTMAEYLAAYTNQLAYINDRLLRLVDDVVEHNPEAIVVVFSDHGSQSHFDWEDADTDLDERFSNLFAARTPGAEGLFTDAQTPINVFPSILNAYFGHALPTHEDATYSGILELAEVPNPDARD